MPARSCRRGSCASSSAACRLPTCRASEKFAAISMSTRPLRRQATVEGWAATRRRSATSTGDTGPTRSPRRPGSMPTTHRRRGDRRRERGIMRSESSGARRHSSGRIDRQPDEVLESSSGCRSPPGRPARAARRVTDVVVAAMRTPLRVHLAPEGRILNPAHENPSDPTASSRVALERTSRSRCERGPNGSTSPVRIVREASRRRSPDRLLDRTSHSVAGGNMALSGDGTAGAALAAPSQHALAGRAPGRTARDGARSAYVHSTCVRGEPRPPGIGVRRSRRGLEIKQIARPRADVRDRRQDVDGQCARRRCSA